MIFDKLIKTINSNIIYT